MLIDSRSEGEYEKGHLPGAVNIPLLNNENRAIIGKIFKENGRQDAVLKGFELAGPLFHQMITQTLTLTDNKEVMVYCWRGGMRSNILAWLLNMSGFNVLLLKGGYKSYRQWALQQLAITRKLIILGGKTGSGKTAMLQYIHLLGKQMICLESLANHKGSAFGSLGQLPQPTQEAFENLLAFQLAETDPTQKLWLENESRNIGFIKIPDPLFEMMRVAPVIEMDVKQVIRKERILNEYGVFTSEQLEERTRKLTKRMGGQHVKSAIEFLMEGDVQGWVLLLLNYYDKTYDHSNSQRPPEKIHTINVEWSNPDSEVLQLIAASEKLN